MSCVLLVHPRCYSSCSWSCCCVAAAASTLPACLLCCLAASCATSLHDLRTLNGVLGGLEAQTHILVPAQTTLARDLGCYLLGPARYRAAAGEPRYPRRIPEMIMYHCTRRKAQAWLELLNLPFICGRAMAVVLTAAYPRFTPSCFWNALSVCKQNVKVSSVLQSSSRQRCL